MLAQLIAPLVSAVLSVLQAITLRHRYYLQQSRIEVLETALEDCGRVNSHSSLPNPLIARIVESTLVK